MDANDSEYSQVERRHGVRFDGTVNLGHVLTFTVGMFAGVAAWNGMDKRVLVLEEARTVQIQRDAQQDTVTRERMADINQSLSKIDSRLEKIIDQQAGVRGAAK